LVVELKVWVLGLRRLVVHEQAHGRSASVLVLPGAHRPDKSRKEARGNQDAQGDEDQDNDHTVTSLKSGVAIFPSPARRLSHFVAPQANATTVTELNGIRMAQTTGDNRPLAATLIPATL
jgi:hypothetical protein